MPPPRPVVCGRPGGCSEAAGLKEVDELHEVRLQRIHPPSRACVLTVCLGAARGQVRCCSDTQLSTTWLKNTEYGCSVWGGSLQEGAISLGEVTTACKENQNLAQAVALCYGAGARLCTVAELEAGCAAHTGCGFDDDLVWGGVSSPFASPVG